VDDVFMMHYIIEQQFVFTKLTFDNRFQTDLSPSSASTLL